MQSVGAFSLYVYSKISMGFALFENDPTQLLHTGWTSAVNAKLDCIKNFEALIKKQPSLPWVDAQPLLACMNWLACACMPSLWRSYTLFDLVKASLTYRSLTCFWISLPDGTAEEQAWAAPGLSLPTRWHHQSWKRKSWQHGWGETWTCDLHYKMVPRPPETQLKPMP